MSTLTTQSSLHILIVTKYIGREYFTIMFSTRLIWFASIAVIFPFGNNVREGKNGENEPVDSRMNKEKKLQLQWATSLQMAQCMTLLFRV